MRILVFGVEYKNDDFEFKKIENEEEFFSEILNKNYEVLIINFEYFSSFLEVNNFFDGVVIFVYYLVDEMIYKKSLEVGDYFYTFDELWKIKYRLKYIAKKKGIKDKFIYKNLVFDLKNNMLYKDKKRVKLSPAERDILSLLIRNKNRFISKEFIIQNSENIDNISSIKVLISKLRKLGFEVENQKNLGYKIKE